MWQINPHHRSNHDGAAAAVFEVMLEEKKLPNQQFYICFSGRAGWSVGGKRKREGGRGTGGITKRK